jgi:electron transport complex protein RnfC
VVTAVTKASTAQLSYGEQKARLERLLAAARNSLASASAPLVPKNTEFPITEEQLVRQKSRIKQTELKLAEAEKKLADFLAENKQPLEDPIATAIAKAQSKLSASPDEKLRANIELLTSRLNNAQEKAHAAKAAGSPSANALQQAVEKLQQKITDAQEELNNLTPVNSALVKAEQNAATQAISRAKAKADARANMSDEEKREAKIKELQNRLRKAKKRLEEAESENNGNVEAFRAAMINLEEKLKEFLP